MPSTLRINFIYMQPETKERFTAASENLGWPYRTLAQQVIQAFFKKHRDFYVEAALKDAAARGMDEGDYYRVLRDVGEDSLVRYVSGKPGFGPAPLDPVEPIPTGEDFKQKYNTITLSSYNYVLLRVAKIADADGSSLTQVISRMVKYHFDTYWASNYEPQILLDHACKFR
jgi:predicted DNA-binding protein